jgi:hypothetical protein
MFNALQPGAFAVSGWDLAGALTLDASEVASLIYQGDTRWINRGAHDLMAFDPGATRSEAGMPKARSLYGTLPSQLADDSSFVSGLRRLIDVRRRYSIATGRQVDVPDVPHKAMLVMVHCLEDDLLQITVLNFSSEHLVGNVRSDFLRPSSTVTDMFTDEPVATVDGLHSFSLTLGAYVGTSLLICPPPPVDITVLPAVGPQ